MKTLALITARAGSKRVPYKNLMLLAGKSLYQWTTDLPLLDVVDAVAFSGDNLDAYRLPLHIMQIERPADLCQDNTPHAPVLIHGLEEAEKRTHTEFDYLMLLQPTNPLRTMEEVRRAVLLAEKNECGMLQSYYIDYNLDMSYVGHMGHGPVEVLSGCVYMYRREYVYNMKDAVPSYTKMEVHKSRGYNINTAEDFKIAEALLS